MGYGAAPLTHPTGYIFCRIHKTLRITPAMAAGVTDHVWNVADIVAVIEATEPAPAKRGLTKKGIRNDEALEASPQAFPCD